MSRREFWKRRAAHLLLIGGLGLLLAFALGATPREQTLVFSRAAGPVSVLQLSIHDTEGDEVAGLTLNFPEGRSRPVRHSVELPNGEYDVHIRVVFLPDTAATARARPETNRKQRVTLRGGETPISL